MDFFDNDYEEDYVDYNNIRVSKWSFINKKYIIIIGVLILAVLVFLIVYNSSSNRYKRIEKGLVASAKAYIDDNYITVNQEIYLDVSKLDYKLDNECSKISGVFYDGYNYRAYLSCGKYQSKIIDNDNSWIKLNGNDVIVLVKGMSFIDPGYSGYYDVDVNGEVGTEEGVYNIYYSINDSSLVRKVVIIDNEELYSYFPTISLNGEDIVNVFVGENYDEQGAIAVDDVDGDISNKVIVNGEIDVNNVGEYKKIYSVTNSNGYSSNIIRIINVIDKDTSVNINHIINPSTMVNTDVNIIMKISGNGYDYTILPDGTRTNDVSINYKVEKNGIYTFSIYDKGGNVTKRDIEINNIDKVLPTGTCDAVIYDGYTNIIVNSLSNKSINFYNYSINNNVEKKQISSIYRYNSTSVSSAKVTLHDSIGNINTINCDVANYLSWKADFSKTFVYITDDENNIIKKYSLDDYLASVLYAAFGSIDFTEYSDSQLINLFKIYFIAKKSEVFYSGKYSVNSKELIYKINNSKYCDVNLGCKIVNKNNKNFYLANDIKYDVDYVLDSKEPLNENILNLMSRAYNETKKNILVNINFNDVLTKYPISSSNIIDSYKNDILNSIKSNSSYTEIIQKYFSGYKIYNIDSYSNQYEKALKIRYKYWWPIGSGFANNGIYDGYPESTNVINNYGASIKDNKIYDHMTIKGECYRTNVISAWNGTVVNKGVSDDYGNYVIVDYGSGIKFVYGSLQESSIMVKIGDRINKGQLIGKVDKTNNECMLYLEVRLNDQTVNPNEYISKESVRPTFGDKVIYVEGSTVKETVCLSLIESGYSIDTVAGIMANMQRESNFNLHTIGDGGTSVGLVQWHSGRWDNLNNYCNQNIYNAECQLNFMLYELKNNYKSVYSYIIGNYSAYDIAYKFCYNYEIPAARDTSCAKRGELARDTYISYVSNGCR